ncbi:MAG: transglutaminase domain-containing protein [Saccharofermentanales bacterium]
MRFDFRKIEWFTPKKAILILLPAAMLLLFLLISANREPSVSIKNILVLELGSALPSVEEYFDETVEEAFFVEAADRVDSSKTGSYAIAIQVGKRIYASMLKIQDTTPPAGETSDQEIWNDQTLQPADFLISASDLSPVVSYFKNAPDFTQPGIQDVVIVLEDAFRNKSELTARLTVLEDTEPPVISGVKNLSLFLGNKILYKRGISVTDNKDEDVAFTIDNSDVNLMAVGKYEVIYSAADRSGNTVSVKATVWVNEPSDLVVSQEEVDVCSDAVLNQIIEEGMTDRAKMWAIFRWISKNVQYTGTASKSDWLKGAFLGFRYGTGDCFTYYSVSRALLTRAGFEVLPVQRVPAPTRHYWVLIQYEDQWYHFDPSPRSAGYSFQCFLRSKPEVDAYTALIWDVKQHYFDYDATGLPEAAAEPLN